MVWEAIRFSPRALVKTALAKVAASGRLRAVRLLFETSKGWSLAVAVLAVADAVLPNLLLIALGAVVGDVPAAIRQGMGSAAGHQLELSLWLAGAVYLANLLIDPFHDVLKLVRSHLNNDLQARLMSAVSGPPGSPTSRTPRSSLSSPRRGANCSTFSRRTPRSRRRSSSATS